VIFVDTGPFLARHVSKDQLHAKARRAWKDLERAKPSPLFTSSFVLDETFTLLARRTSYVFAAERAEAIYASSVLTVLRPDAMDEVTAIAFFRKLADQEVSFTDCVSFALMRRHRLTRAFTFDRHFAAAGFTVWP
jgi:predicted nucleic acid-binding protein